MAFAGDFTGGKAVDAVEAEDGEGGGMFAAAGSVEVVEELEEAGGRSGLMD